MQTASVQKIAKVLSVLVLITFICNLIALILMPALVGLKGNWVELIDGTMWNDPYEPINPLLYIIAMWPMVFHRFNEATVLTLFLLASGVCTAVILWQGRRVLKTILRGQPFSMENAVSLRRAAVCGFLISAAALVRLVFSLFYTHSLQPLATYNALFVPIFAMFGLLCLVMSALFRQAAELKAENDLTI